MTGPSKNVDNSLLLVSVDRGASLLVLLITHRGEDVNFSELSFLSV